MQKKVFALDLDGTLTEHRTWITDENLAALDELKDSGLRLVIVGAGQVRRIFAQLRKYPIEILNLSFQQQIYLFVGLCALPVVLVSMVEVCFRAPLDLPLLSFDRFLLFRTLIPGLNMMVVPFILGVLFSSIFDTFFYICIIAGFIVFLLLDRVVRKQVNGRLLNGVGLVLMCVAVWLLGCSTEKGMLMGAGFLTGLGMGFSLLQFLRMMIRLPLHCERGTGYHTYQLLWESGVMLGVFFGKYTEDISGQQFRAASLILLAGLLIYQAVVHGYFMKRMKNR